jgi:hypothetical protein
MEQRNPGRASVKIPDFASRHPGYAAVHYESVTTEPPVRSCTVATLLCD